jgi:hypothetical protein
MTRAIGNPVRRLSVRAKRTVSSRLIVSGNMFAVCCIGTAGLMGGHRLVRKARFEVWRSVFRPFLL